MVNRILEFVQRGGRVLFRPSKLAGGLSVVVLIDDAAGEYDHSREVEFFPDLIADYAGERLAVLVEQSIGSAIDLVLQKRDGNE